MKTRMLLFSLILLSGSLLSAASGGEEFSFPKLKGWKLDVSSRVYTPDNLWDLINGAAESYLSYGFQDLHLADYTCKCGLVIHTEIYLHSNRNNAFGIYSSERSSGYDFLEIGTQGYQGEGILNFFIGEYYVKLYSTGEGENVQAALAQIGKAVSDHLGDDKTWPELLDYFPPEGKILNEDHYVQENFMGLNFLHSAFTAEYEGGYRLFLIQGSERAEIIEMLQAYLKFTKQDTDPEKEASFVIRDKYNGDIPVVIHGAYLAGIIEGAENESAGAGLSALVKSLPSKD